MIIKKFLCFLIIVYYFNSSSHAAITITVEQIGTDVRVRGEGVINTSGLGEMFTTSHTTSGIKPYNPPGGGSRAGVFIGINGGFFLADVYRGAGFPNDIGIPGLESTVTTPPTIAVGSRFGIYEDLLYLPPGYISGDFIQGSMLIPDTTISAIGLQPNTSFSSSWGSGSTTDSFTLSIVPEPSSTLLIGFGCLSFVFRRSRNS